MWQNRDEEEDTEQHGVPADAQAPPVSVSSSASSPADVFPSRKILALPKRITRQSSKNSDSDYDEKYMYINAKGDPRSYLQDNVGTLTSMVLNKRDQLALIDRALKEHDPATEIERLVEKKDDPDDDEVLDTVTPAPTLTRLDKHTKPSHLHTSLMSAG